MPFTLWSRGILLGRTSPAPADQSGNCVGGFFHPTSDFHTLGPPLLRMGAESIPLAREIGKALPTPDELAGLSTEERALRIRQAMLVSPAVERSMQLQEAVAEMALELRNEDGVDVPVESVMIWRNPIDDPEGRSAAMVVAHGLEYSELMLQATLKGSRSA